MMREAAKDRISDLPDSLIHHIHYFLHIKDGARTSILSKRWNYLWTTIPILDFRSLDYDSIATSETEKFMDFVDGTLNRHKLSNVDKFSLRWSRHLNEFRVHNWISSVVRGNVKQLTLNLCQRQPLFIPLSLFTCESLVSLELDTYPSIRLPKYISFPSLKRLQLCEFKFTDECWNEELFSNSTVLEELILVSCIYSMRSFCISIPTLKCLTIDSLNEEENGLRDCVFKIDAPRLVTFVYWGYGAKEFVLSSFEALVEATVYFNCQNNVGTERISQFLRALAHVKCLTVYNPTLKAICSAYDLSNNLLTFHNVKMLKISDDITSDDQGLIAFLKAVPKLESLVLDGYMNHKEDKCSNKDNESSSGDDDENDRDDAEVDGDDSNEDDAADSVEGENNHHTEDEGDVTDAAECEDNYEEKDYSLLPGIVTTGCMFLHLKSVCFRVFAGNSREMKWVRLILRNAKALQMMTIHYHNFHIRAVNVRSEKELMVELPSLPRASPGCVIKFYSPENSVVFH